jgi:hypothetical protein
MNHMLHVFGQKGFPAVVSYRQDIVNAEPRAVCIGAKSPLDEEALKRAGEPSPMTIILCECVLWVEKRTEGGIEHGVHNIVNRHHAQDAMVNKTCLALAATVHRTSTSMAGLRNACRSVDREQNEDPIKLNKPVTRERYTSNVIGSHLIVTERADAIHLLIDSLMCFSNTN